MNFDREISIALCQSSSRLIDILGAQINLSIYFLKINHREPPFRLLLPHILFSFLVLLLNDMSCRSFYSNPRFSSVKTMTIVVLPLNIIIINHRIAWRRSTDSTFVIDINYGKSS